MKKLLILIAIVVVIGLAAPFFIGNKAEAEFRKAYSEINLGPDLTFEVVEYNKGWFSSTATVAAIINMAFAEPGTTGKFTTYLKHDIQHGPLLTKTKAMGLGILDLAITIEAPEVVTSEAPQFNKILNEVVSLSARFGMSGDVASVININEYEDTVDAATITVRNGAINFNSTADKKVVFDGEWSGLSMTSPGQGEFTMGPVSMTGDMVPPADQQLAAYGIYLGTSKATVNEIKFTGASPMENFLMTNMTMTSDTTINDDSMNATLDMTVAEINVMGMTFTDFIYDLALNSLNVPALMKVNELTSQMSTPQMTEEDMNAMMEALMMLLQAQPELVINNLGLTTPQGAITNTANIGVDPALIDPKNPLTFMTGIKIDAQGSIPEAFLQTMGVMPLLQSYITEGLLEVESGSVNYDMVFERGQMLMFGKPYSWNRLMN